MCIRDRYITIFDTPYQKYLKAIDVKDTHKGYFSIDKKGLAVDSKVKRGSDFSDDISAYDLILCGALALLGLVLFGWALPSFLKCKWSYLISLLGLGLVAFAYFDSAIVITYKIWQMCIRDSLVSKVLVNLHHLLHKWLQKLLLNLHKNMVLKQLK